MTGAITQPSAENTGCARRLPSHKQPGFCAALESALVLAERELWLPRTPREASASRNHDR